ncbi:DUF4810 domain-containing protein [Ectopseudomonas guguanensis]|jgi:hypothetical protein|uniref:DUF4810 domain-containing protein n=1 Tax=Ectopseudomonas guguanensis TaxID=1198456 RepID=UPI0012D5314A|nr:MULTISPECIES: DUF4810 domain-containing protein [Pseudomonas]MDR8015823.1 DUF4810 domain-containing protein [Pseudomonas guguanensis]MPT19061.1 DUF4810 domain-containing protein [Pseudomonas sp.]WJH56413.1 DUF4810 domain-containing protein [Pseudomonas guguanensis]
MIAIRKLAALSAMLVLGVLGGCASGPQSLYYWDGYQQQVYQRFDSKSSTEEQIAALEASVQKARAADRTLPPGFHAHLGMLYADAGKLDQVRQQFETEKALYPESATYMDFLMRKFDK